ncbi:MAG: Nif3-like dinuclear metal center hexameric protein [Syntrophomonadaceae bacterium]|nr:Nif3-like dinuclear metal center hexameric protein [Syntrophomonadaceae bacterium]
MKARVRDLMQIMEQSFPVFLAEEWDNTGLQVGDPDQVVQRLLIALDLDQAVLEQAREQKVDMVITHHPLIFKALKKLDYSQSQADMIRRLIQAGISVYAAHTNLDSAPNGLNQYLAETLGLIDIKPLFNAITEELYKIVVFIPVTHLETVREAMAAAGAGHIGRYSDCTFSAKGTGTFRPGEDTNPWQGKTGKLEMADEFRLETVAYRESLPGILAAMQKAHPYEEIAFDLYRLENHGKTYCPGRCGRLQNPSRLDDYAAFIKGRLGLDAVRVVGDIQRTIEDVAVVSGSGASFLDNCIQQGVDLLVTGDLKYHDAKNAEAAGIALIDAGHQGTEQIAVQMLYELFEAEKKYRNLEVSILKAFQASAFKNI